MLSTFMEVLDASIANAALPHIAGRVSAGVDESTRVLTSYLVSSSIVLPLSGWFSRLFWTQKFLHGVRADFYCQFAAQCACADVAAAGVLPRVARSRGWRIAAGVASDPGGKFSAREPRFWRETNRGALRAAWRLFFVAEVGDYQADFFEGDFCGEVFLQRAKKIQATLCAGVLNQGEAFGADPGGIEGQLALLDEIGDQCDHCGDLAAAELGNFAEGVAFFKELQRFLRGIGCTGVPLLAGALAFLEAAEHVEDFLAVLIALRFADAGNLAKFGKSFGTYGADLLQRSIVHHDESGAIPFSRGVSSPLLQKLAEFFIDRDGNVPLEGCCFGPASRA
jgi:hypothetical protein